MDYLTLKSRTETSPNTFQQEMFDEKLEHVALLYFHDTQVRGHECISFNGWIHLTFFAEMSTGREYFESSVGINNKLSKARHPHNEPFHSVKSSAPAAEKTQLWKEPGPRLWHHRLCSLSHRRPGQQNRLLSDVSALAPTQAAILNPASHLAQKAFGARASEAESGFSHLHIYTLCRSSTIY